MRHIKLTINSGMLAMQCLFVTSGFAIIKAQSLIMSLCVCIVMATAIVGLETFNLNYSAFQVVLGGNKKLSW